MHFLCRSFIGRDQSFWSRFWENEPDDPSLRQSKGHLFALLSLTAAGEFELAPIGRRLIDEITSAYLSSDSITTQDSFNSIATILASPSYSTLNPTLVLLVLIGTQLHLFAHGDTSIYLYRGTKFCQLLTSSVALPAFLTGPIEPTDLVLFGHLSFFDQWGHHSLAQSLPTAPSQLEDVFLTKLMEFANQSTAAALVRFEADVDTLVASPPPLSPTTFSPPPSTRPSHSSVPSVYVASPTTFYHQTTRRINLIASLLVIIVVGSLIVFGYQRNRQISISRQIQKLSTGVESKLKQALDVKNLDPDAALKLINLAKTELSELDSISPTSVKVVSLNKQLQDLAASVGSGADFKPVLFYDASLLAPNSRYQKMLVVGENLALLNIAAGRLDLVNFQLRSKTNLYQGSGLANLSYFWVSGSAVMAGSDTQLVSINSQIKSLISFTSPVPYTAAASWNNNAYLVGPSLTEIYKLIPKNTDEFSPPKPWLAQGKLDFSPVSIAINGKIYLLGSDCRVRLYDRGLLQTFISVPVTTCRSPSSLSINLSGERIAFLDNGKSVYLLDAKGEIKSRYSFSDKTFLDVILHPTQAKIYFLSSDQKIYYLDL